ncbi:MAG: hypothetical protein N2505_07060, partial [Endomicrobia bacterium]|nr:hypothetical protein [Endomicrobiia bacterium]
ITDGGNSFIFGYLNRNVSGIYNFLIGGEHIARGDYSFSLGYRSSTTATGCFTYSSYNILDGYITNDTPGLTIWKSHGGVLFTTTSAKTPALFISSIAFVGINTSTPSHRFTVNGDMNVDSGTLFVSAINDRVGIGTISPTARCEIVGFSGISPVLRVSTSIVGGDSIIVSTTGVVGIRTPSPTTTLDVNGLIRVR